MNEPLEAPRKSNTGLIIGLVVGGVVLLGLVLGGCLIGLLLPSLSTARDSARELRSMTHARAIWQATMAYNHEYNVLPDPGADLATVLVPDYAAPEVFISPFAPAGSRATGYIYVAPGDLNRTDNPIILYQDPALRPGGRVIILRMNGEVELVDEPVFRRLLAEDEARAPKRPDE